MAIGVDAVTVLVLAVNVALVDRAATETLVGTVAADELLERLTTAPLPGAAPLRVTVPVEEVPPVTLVGFSVTEDSATGPAPPPYPEPLPQAQAHRDTKSRKKAAAAKLYCS